ncbi:hypothetical protein G9A89_003137 [Geosiphon pyriformis]|nr:hypothetical protein G9A89_003137 [Geosiphon pyriformis]
MTRAIETATFLSITSVIYFLLLFKFVPTPAIFQEKILPVLPWWSLVSFGAYSLGNIGYHIFKFRDCDDAYFELMEQIQEAKTELRAKGVSIDND